MAAIAVAIIPASEARKREPKQIDWAAFNADELQRHGADALRGGRADEAIGAYAELASRRPRDGSSQALLALSYHIAGKERAEAIDLALAGYEVAMRVDPGQFWPSAMAGRASFDQGKYTEALDLFSRALILRPNDPRLVGAVASAAYMNGDAALAHLAADRAVTLDGANNAALLGLAVMAAAADNDAPGAARHLARLAMVDAAAATVGARAAQINQTAAIDAPSAPVDELAALSPASPDQISLDVAIVLSQNTRRERNGINLLDGLSLQYGLGRNSTTSVSDSGGTRNGDTYQRVITSSITVPQLNYNLNLFNRGSLEQIDIGVDLKVTPIEITATGTRVRIETERSFLTSDPAGTFREALTTFRQKVVATAEIRFGETLLLSGLNETVDDMTFSKTPVLGDLPVVGNLFSERNKTQRRDSVIVLVTPARPMSLAGRPWARTEHAGRLAKLWTNIVDPTSNAGVAERRLGGMRMFTRMTRSDVAMPFPDAGQAAGEIIGELLLPRSQ